MYAYSILAMPAESTICNAVKDMIASEYSTDLAVALINNYASCGHLLEAEQFFENICEAQASVSVLLWNIMIKVC